MSVLVELGRFLLVDALRKASHATAQLANVLDVEEQDTFPTSEAGDLLTEEAAAMVAAREPPPLEEEHEPPPEGSLEARGRKVGERWAQ